MITFFMYSCIHVFYFQTYYEMTMPEIIKFKVEKSGSQVAEDISI